ncbi:hypothetical protein NLM33_41675 [Bradyrhizobium sp. CCGUVB1N3]|uniref:hypothetical protein n=1 Tax=Bradyrhizobium sp. CCGUVB1N3 TaxID=2949629 RepID=UPI0020B2E4AF|nr:hypothetical protein [Bradyrhizobium sp. CCGUVB1N3]MCP3476676.1 hypothetical protein [Bradyrhizobium sp. CCGUVB1N3]
MLLWTITELMHLTRDELCNLDGNMRHALAEFEAGTCERDAVLTSLANIRRAMVWRGLYY